MKKLLLLGLVLILLSSFVSAGVQDFFNRTEASATNTSSWGTSLNGNKWLTSAAGTGEVNGSVGIYLPDAVPADTEAVDLTFNDTAATRLDFRIMWDSFGTAGQFIEVRDQAATKYNMYIRDDGAGKMQNHNGAALENWNVGGVWTPKIGVWHNISIRDIQATTFDFYINGTLWGNNQGKFHDNFGVGRLVVGSRVNSNFYIDNVCINGECPEEAVPPIPATPVNIHQYTEETIKQEQVTNITITSNLFQNIMTGNFEIQEPTNVTFSYTLNGIATQASNNMECRVNVNGSYYNTTTSRSMTINQYGSLYLTSTPSLFAVGNYTSSLQCRRTGAANTFQLSNGLGIIHLLINESNPINYEAQSLNLNLNSSTYSKLLSFDFETTNGTIDINHTKHIVLDGALTYNYATTGTISLYAAINGTILGEYPRYGTAGSTGSVGGLMIEAPPGIVNISQNITIDIYGKSTNADGTITGNFIVKEFLLGKDEANSTKLNNTNFSSATYTDLANITISNTDHTLADIVVKAGIPHKTLTGSARTTFRLRITGENGAEMIRDISTANQEGVAIIQDVFNATTGDYTVFLQGKTNNSIYITGGDLSAYVASYVPLTPNVTGIIAHDYYNGSYIDSFSITTGSGTTLSTDDGLIKFTPTNITENITASATNYFSNTTEVTFNESINISLIPYTKIQAYSLTGTPLTGLSVNYSGTNYPMTGASAYIPLFNETAEVTLVGNGTYSSLTANLTASPYLKAYNFTLYYWNTINILIYDFDNKSLIDGQNVTIRTIGLNLSYSQINKTETGNISLTFLAPDSYELRFNATNYNTVSKFLTVTNDSTNFIEIYLQKNNTELQTIIVKDLSNSNVEGAIVRVQREYVTGTTLEWLTIQEAITDYNGQTGIFIEKDTDVYYRFAVIYQEELRPIQPAGNYFTSKTFFVPGVDTAVEIVINTEDSNINDDLPQWLNVVTNMTVSEDNKTVNFTFNDGQSLISGGRLKVYGKYLINGTNYELISTQDATGSDGLLTYTVPIANNTMYLFEGYIIVNGDEFLAETTTTSFTIDVIVDKDTGLIYAVIIFLVVALLTASGHQQFGNRATLPSALLAIASLWIPTFIGFISLPYTIISSLLALAVILFMRFSKE